MLLPMLYLLVFATCLSLLLIAPARRLSKYLGVMDYPVGKKTHRVPMPLLGGVAIFLACYATVGIHLVLRSIILHLPQIHEGLPYSIKMLLDIRAEGLHDLAVILGGGVMIFIVGLLDDCVFFDIRWRLLSELIIAGIVTYLGIRPELNGIPMVLTWGITILWIVGVTNAFNLLDGMDGVAAGVAIISAGLMSIFCLMTGQVMIGILLLIICGSSAGFLKHNWSPARIYMGSSGSLFLGYMLATIPLVAAFMQKGGSLGAVAMPFLILSIPLYDTLSVIVIRIRNRRSPFLSDHNHLFHRLRRLGFSDKRVACSIYLLTFAVGVSAMLLTQAEPWEIALIAIHILAIYGAVVVIEMASMRENDRNQIVHLPARYCFKGAVESTRAETGEMREETELAVEYSTSSANSGSFPALAAVNTGNPLASGSPSSLATATLRAIESKQQTKKAGEKMEGDRLTAHSRRKTALLKRNANLGQKQLPEASDFLIIEGDSENESQKTPGRGSGWIRMLNSDKVEMEIVADDFQQFADALLTKEPLALEILPTAEGIESLAVSCQVESLWHPEPERGLVGLNFQFHDEEELRHIYKVVKDLLYPDRALNQTKAKKSGFRRKTKPNLPISR